MPTIRAVVISPFSLGNEDNERRSIIATFETVLDAVQNPHSGLHTSPERPILVVNRVTQEKGDFVDIQSFLTSRPGHRDCWEIVQGWSVDTCQDWLQGWGKVLDDWEKHADEHESQYLLQIPGDLRDVGNHSDPSAMHDFLNSLRTLAALAVAGNDFVIGDYELKDYGGKYLIDAYGTMPLLYNWFPDVAVYIREELHLTRPRSEFIAAEVHFLREMLVNHRRFAYEQTTAFLINALCGHPERRGVARACTEWKIQKAHLGRLQDHTGDRGFREAVDQLERMERMLRLLWRTLHGNDKFDVDRYMDLDARSAAIRSAAMVTFRNFLQPSGGASDR